MCVGVQLLIKLYSTQRINMKILLEKIKMIMRVLVRKVCLSFGVIFSPRRNARVSVKNHLPAVSDMTRFNRLGSIWSQLRKPLSTNLWVRKWLPTLIWIPWTSLSSAFERFQGTIAICHLCIKNSSLFLRERLISRSRIRSNNKQVTTTQSHICILNLYL